MIHVTLRTPNVPEWSSTVQVFFFFYLSLLLRPTPEHYMVKYKFFPHLETSLSLQYLSIRHLMANILPHYFFKEEVQPVCVGSPPDYLASLHPAVD